MANALVIHKDRLPQSQRMYRAAQYVRMSTEFQQYSIENQAVVIAAYAQLHNLPIVRTYRDEGESGLTIKNRMGLADWSMMSGLAIPISVLFSSLTSAVGDGFRTLMRARTTSSFANKRESKLPIARSSFRTTVA